MSDKDELDPEGFEDEFADIVGSIGGVIGTDGVPLLELFEEPEDAVPFVDPESGSPPSVEVFDELDPDPPYSQEQD